MNVAQMEHADCYVCGERLTDPQSVSRGTGPVCAAKLSGFLAAAGSSVEEIAELALIDDATVARWLRKVACAVRAGRKGDAEFFISAARRAAAVAQSDPDERMAA